MEDRYESPRGVRTRVIFGVVLPVVFCVCLAGCSDQIDLPSAGQLLEFENAGPVSPTVDMDRLARARIGGGPYRVVPGDVLELTMPAILQVVTAEGAGGTEQAAPYVCRVNESGTVSLPVVGDMQASGKTLGQIESEVIDAYYPAYAVTRPSVFVRVLEYETAKVSVTGAVQKPGIYALRSDQMSLVAVLTEAGGIIDDGAARISIIHQDQAAVRRVKSIGKTLPLSIEARAVIPMEVRFSFRQDSPSSTNGELSITDMKGRVVVCEHLDVTKEVERQVLLDQLEASESRISTLEVSERLCALAEQLKPGSGRNRAGAAPANRRTYAGTATMVQLASTQTMSPASGSEPAAASQPNLYEHMSEGGKEAYRALRGRDNSPNTPEPSPASAKEPESLVLPVKGFNIPFADVVLRDGDSVIVERLQPPLFTVMGLVSRPGNFPYPPDVRYNLAQALAFAGGLNEVADPRYASIYRLTPDGQIVSVVLPILDGSRLTDAANMLIKPGDIVAVEHTPRTRTAVFLDRIFRLNIGTYWTMNDLWD